MKLLSFLCFAFLLMNCAPVRIRHVDLVQRRDDLVTPATSKQRRTSRTEQTLRIHNIPNQIARSTEIAALKEIYLETKDRRVLASLCELSWLYAEDVKDHDPARSLEWFMKTIIFSYEYLFCDTTLCFAHAFDPRYAQVREIYNLSVGRYVMLFYDMMGAIDVHSVTLDDQVVPVYPAADGVDPNDFTELYLSRELRVRGLENQYEAYGVGAALTGFRENLGEGPLDHLYPPEGIPAPITAFIYFDDDHPISAKEPQAWFSFYDPRHKTSINIDGIEVPLSADFTTPYAYLVQRANLRQLGLRGLFNAAAAENHRGLFLLEPYNPSKIPLVMVHGLLSSPLAWLEITNDIHGDPELRDKYQIWHYMYPTGYPILYNARVFRQDLENALRDLDPEEEHLATGEIILIAHSMGGVLCRTLVTDSENKIWDVSFSKPIEELVLSDDERSLVKDTFYFEPNPRIKRAIFIATPHRGSDKADNFLGRLGNLLLRLPIEFVSLTKRLVQNNREFVNEPLREMFEKGEVTSIRTLEVDNPIIQTLGNLPIPKSFKVHSILGNGGKPDADEVSDGYVPYWSGHLEEAVSETVLPYGHDVHTKPESIREIKQILKQHLLERITNSTGAGLRSE